MFKSITLPITISFFAFIASFCILIFGNNVNDQLKEAEIVYDSQKVELRLPSKIKFSNSTPDSIPDSYRQIRIRNIGPKPSQDLKISIDLDGEEIESELKCVETIKETIHGKSQIQVSLDRFTNNAEIVCKVWLKQNQNNFSIKSIDGRGVKDVYEANTINHVNYVKIIASIIMTAIILFLIYKLYILPKITAYGRLIEDYTEIQGQYEQLSNELDNIRTKTEDDNSQGNINFMTKLQELVKEHNNTKG